MMDSFYIAKLSHFRKTRVWAVANIKLAYIYIYFKYKNGKAIPVTCREGP
jgi:hypothetical protein